MTYWLVGDAPSREGVDLARSLTPDDTGVQTLANCLLKLTGWTLDEFLEVFAVRTTVWKQHWPQWMDEGRKQAALIGRDSRDADGVVVVGHRAAVVFGLEGQAFEWCGRFAAVPHPAPTRLNRTPGAVERAHAFFGEILERHRSRRVHGSRSARRKG